MKSNMFSKVETVTPTKAKQLLTKANPNNREKRSSYVAELAREILAGEWRLTHQGIAFTESGMLIDGHNRLRAIVLANKPAELYVTYNAPNEYVLLDGQRPRTLKDRAREAGIAFWNVFIQAMVVRAYFGMNTTRNMSYRRKLALVVEHREAALFIAQRMRKYGLKNLRRAGVIGAFLRFYYSAPKEMVAEAISALVAPEESKFRAYDVSPLRALRNYLLESNTKQEAFIRGGGSALENELYRVTTYALKKFLDQEPVRKVKLTEKEYFSFPSNV